MRTTFRPRNSSSPWGKRLAYSALLLLAAALILHYFRSPAISLAKPLWLTENAVSRGFDNLIGFLRGKDALVAENRILRERMASLEALEVSYRALESSRDELLERFGRVATSSAIAAGVLAQPPQTPYDILVIDAGSADGISSGDKVSLSEGGALGLVSEVYAREAKVLLYSSSGTETSAFLERGNVPVTLAGQGGGTFAFSLPRHVDVEPGDRVLLPGLSGELVAVVAEVELEPTDSEKRVLAGGVGNVSALRFVSVR